VLGVAFTMPLVDLVRLALRDDTHSHVLLIPFISVYLIWQHRASLPGAMRSCWRGAAITALLSLLPLAVSLMGWVTPANADDRLSLVILAFAGLVFAAALACLGTAGVWQMLFPLLFLFFVVPLPSPVIVAIEKVLQHASAEAAHLFFWVSGETFLRSGLQFRLPGLTVEVAQECSGIRSTLVLVITGLLAAYLFLRTNSRRVALVLLVVPIAILRNGFRVFVISALTVHVNPEIINSPLHHSGGPIFFALSLIPLFLVLWLLKRTERHQTKVGQASRLSSNSREV
jgi:exosortase C (VPDSG-CTERM-specific)